MRDDDVRAALFAALDVLQAQCGPDIPREALARGFSFRGTRVPFLNFARGIHRARAQRGPAALTINTAYTSSRYRDEERPDGVLYAYQDGPVDNHHNRALRQAHLLQVPIAYLIGTRPGWYRPEYPAWIAEDDPPARRVLVTFGRMRGPYDEREPVQIADEIERRHVLREVRRRVHQARFRGAVLPAYEDRCAICRLREIRLLDAAHITADAEQEGAAVVSNGLSMCTLHHRAYDQDLVGVAPDHRVHLSRRLLDDDDGPMLDLLKAAHGSAIALPRRRASRPDAERLAIRFERFLRSG